MGFGCWAAPLGCQLGGRSATNSPGPPGSSSSAREGPKIGETTYDARRRNGVIEGRGLSLSDATAGAQTEAADLVCADRTPARTLPAA